MPDPRRPFLDISVTSNDTAHVVRAAGELDLGTREELRGALDALTKPPMIVALELSDLRFIDSTGLKTVLDEHRRARADGYEFVVVGASGAVREAFRISALDISLPMAPDLAAVVGT